MGNDIAADTAELTSARESARLPSSPVAVSPPRSRSMGARRATTDASSLFSTYGRDVYCVIDDALHCHSLSRNWETISGFAAEEDIGEGLRDRIAPDHMHKITHYLALGEAATAPVRFQIKHQDGRWRWCEMLRAGEPGADGLHHCLLHDVTELVSAQGKLEKAKLEAELAIKSRSEFLANMSHELRTPLNAILGFAQMMETGTYGELGHPKYHDYIGSIQESGSTLLSKINDLLEIANIDSGRMELREEPTDLVSLIRHAVEFHSHRAFSGQITLRDRLPALPMRATVDRIRMLQVVTNLLSNAIRYNAPGGTVDVTCKARRDGGINIVIEDTGGGISPVHLQNILSAFRQDNSFFARSRNCIGLGLALSKEIVKLHQGRIDIDSEAGKGTLLTIRLPRERTVKVKAQKAVEA